MIKAMLTKFLLGQIVKVQDERFQALMKDIRNLTDEVKAAHDRISLSNLRVKHLEHYLGLRNHKFPKGEQQWHFHQVERDLKQGVRPSQIRDLRRVA